MDLEKLLELVFSNPDNLRIEYSNIDGKETCFVNGINVLQKEETFDDKEIKKEIASYKESLNYLDEWIWNLVLDEANNRNFNLSEMESVLNLSSYTEETALQAFDTINIMKDIINEILEQEVQKLVDLMKRF